MKRSLGDPLTITAFGKTLYECLTPEELRTRMPKAVKPPRVPKEKALPAIRILPGPEPIPEPVVKAIPKKVVPKAKVPEAPPAEALREEPVIVPEEEPAISGKRKEKNMAGEMIELGMVATSPEECIARGGYVRKAPPRSGLPFVCAKKPKRPKKGKGLGECIGGSCLGDIGRFVKKGERCPVGQTKTSVWNPKTKRYTDLCVKGRGGKRGLGALKIKDMLPAKLDIGMIFLGDAAGILSATVVPKVISALLKTPEAKSKGLLISKIALGVSGVGLYLGTRKSFTLGFAFGVIPGAVESIANLIANAITKPIEERQAKALLGPPAPPALPEGESPQQAGVRSLGQITPAEVRELETIAQRISAGVAGLGENENEEKGVPFRAVA